MIRHPSSVIVAASSGSSKTVLVERLLREKNVFQVPPKKVGMPTIDGSLGLIA